MYVGLDVHKEFCQAAFVDANGTVMKEERFENNSRGLAALSGAVKNCSVVMEASSAMFPVYDALSGSCTVKVAHPLKVKAIASARIKTDKIDARILAQLLRANMVPEAYVPDRERRQTQLLVRNRDALVRSRTRLKNQIHSLFTREGIKPPKSLFAKRGMKFLRTVPLGEAQRLALNSLVAVMETVDAQIAEADARIAVAASQDAYAQIAVTHTGVGPLSALAFSSQVCDITRFKTHKHLCSYLGLVPSTHQSGSTDRHGHITKEGNSMIRWLLIQCAWSAVKHSPRFRRKYRKLEKKIGKKKAIVAIARLIAVDLYFMLVRNEPYRERERKGGKPVELLGPQRPLHRLGSSPLYDPTPCASSTDRSMS